MSQNQHFCIIFFTILPFSIINFFKTNATKAKSKSVLNRCPWCWNYRGQHLLYFFIFIKDCQGCGSYLKNIMSNSKNTQGNSGQELTATNHGTLLEKTELNTDLYNKALYTDNEIKQKKKANPGQKSFILLQVLNS